MITISTEGTNEEKKETVVRSALVCEMPYKIIGTVGHTSV